MSKQDFIQSKSWKEEIDSKISTIIAGLAIACILTVSLNMFTPQVMNRGDGGSHSNAYENGGGIVAKEI